MTQDEFCAMAIADLLDLEEDKANPWNRMALVATFLQSCLEDECLTKEWVSGARLLLKDLQGYPCTRHTLPLSGRGSANPALLAGSRGETRP